MSLEVKTLEVQPMETGFYPETLSGEPKIADNVEPKFLFNSLDEVESSLGDSAEWTFVTQSQGDDILQKEDKGREWLFKNENGEISSLTREQLVGNRHDEILNGLYDQGYFVSQYIKPGTKTMVRESYFADSRGRLSYRIKEAEIGERADSDLDEEELLQIDVQDYDEQEELPAFAQLKKIDLDPELDDGTKPKKNFVTVGQNFWRNLLKPNSDKKSKKVSGHDFTPVPHRPLSEKDRLTNIFTELIEPASNHELDGSSSIAVAEVAKPERSSKQSESKSLEIKEAIAIQAEAAETEEVRESEQLPSLPREKNQKELSTAVLHEIVQQESAFIELVLLDTAEKPKIVQKTSSAESTQQAAEQQDTKDQASKNTNVPAISVHRNLAVRPGLQKTKILVPEQTVVQIKAGSGELKPSKSVVLPMSTEILKEHPKIEQSEAKDVPIIVEPVYKGSVETGINAQGAEKPASITLGEIRFVELKAKVTESTNVLEIASKNSAKVERPTIKTPLEAIKQIVQKSSKKLNAPLGPKTQNTKQEAKALNKLVKEVKIEKPASNEGKPIKVEKIPLFIKEEQSAIINRPKSEIVYSKNMILNSLEKLQPLVESSSKAVKKIEAKEIEQTRPVARITRLSSLNKTKNKQKRLLRFNSANTAQAIAALTGIPIQDQQVKSSTIKLAA